LKELSDILSSKVDEPHGALLETIRERIDEAEADQDRIRSECRKQSLDVSRKRARSRVRDPLRP